MGRNRSDCDFRRLTNILTIRWPVAPLRWALGKAGKSLHKEIALLDSRSLFLGSSSFRPLAAAYFAGLMSRSMPGILPPAWTEGIWPFHFAIQRSVTANCCHLMMF